MKPKDLLKIALGILTSIGGFLDVGALAFSTLCVIFLVEMAGRLAAVSKHAGFIPSLPPKDAAHYWYLSLSIIGAVVSPYLIYFYSSGAVEDKWTTKDLAVNRGVAAIGMRFRSVVAMGVMIAAATTLLPAGVALDRYEQAPLMLTQSFGIAGLYLFAASLGIACLGASVEVALSVAYLSAQTFGWNWGENLPPKRNARFATVYTVFILLAACVTFTGIDPLKLTLFTMALTVVILPLLLPTMIVVMNDKSFLGNRRNGWMSNVMGFARARAAAAPSVPGGVGEAGSQ